MGVPKTYAPEFRRRAIDLVRSGRAVADAAADLGLREATLYRWMAQDRVDRGERPGLTSSEHVELLRARRSVRELETELAITKKAAALFAEGVRPKGNSR